MLFDMITAPRIAKYLAIALAVLLIMAWLVSCRPTHAEKDNYNQKVSGRTATFR